MGILTSAITSSKTPIGAVAELDRFQYPIPEG
jgi:hypothetical protein